MRWNQMFRTSLLPLFCLFEMLHIGLVAENASILNQIVTIWIETHILILHIQCGSIFIKLLFHFKTLECNKIGHHLSILMRIVSHQSNITLSTSIFVSIYHLQCKQNESVCSFIRCILPQIVCDLVCFFFPRFFPFFISLSTWYKWFLI